MKNVDLHQSWFRFHLALELDHWKIGAMLLAYVASFLFSLSGAARVLENNREEIRRLLS